MESPENQNERPLFSPLAFQELKELLQLRLVPLWKQLQRLPECYTQPDFMGDLMEKLISLGEALEGEFSLRDTAVLRHLEGCCEKIFRLWDGGASNPAEWMREFIGAVQEIPEKAEQSIRKGNRRLTVTAVMRNESRYVREWVEYHRLAGVDYFYIYDNESTDGMADLLRPYVDEGLMTVIPWPGKVVQLQAYNDAINRRKTETDYMAFIDADEFLIPKCPGKLLPEIVDYIFEEYRSREFHPPIAAGGIGVNWRVYGTSGHEEPVDGLLIENYLHRARDTIPSCWHIKTICNPRKAAGFTRDPHGMFYQQGYTCISEHGSVIPSIPFFYDARYDRLQINHYYTKSRAEYWYKMKRGWPDQPLRETPDQVIERNLAEYEAWNELYDPVLLPYAEKIKERLAKLDAAEA